MSETMSAIDQLAKRLYEKLEHIDPSESDEWERLPDYDHKMYRFCVEELLMDRGLLISALVEIERSNEVKR